MSHLSGEIDYLKKKKGNKQDRTGVRKNTMFLMASTGVGKENLPAESGRRESRP